MAIHKVIGEEISMSPPSVFFPLATPDTITRVADEEDDLNYVGHVPLPQFRHNRPSEAEFVRELPHVSCSTHRIQQQQDGSFFGKATKLTLDTVGIEEAVDGNPGIKEFTKIIVCMKISIEDNQENIEYNGVVYMNTTTNTNREKMNTVVVCSWKQLLKILFLFWSHIISENWEEKIQKIYKYKEITMY